MRNFKRSVAAWQECEKSGMFDMMQALSRYPLSEQLASQRLLIEGFADSPSALGSGDDHESGI
jgi:hypothetical protein